MARGGSWPARMPGAVSVFLPLFGRPWVGLSLVMAVLGVAVMGVAVIVVGDGVGAAMGVVAAVGCGGYGLVAQLVRAHA